MSDSVGLVRFPDGTIMAGVHQGSSENFRPKLVPLREWNFDIEWGHDIEVMGKVVDVDVYVQYGGGTHWEGKAVQECGVLLTTYYGYDPHDRRDMPYVPYENGTPAWVRDFDWDTLGPGAHNE